jgi:hypothetical protein
MDDAKAVPLLDDLVEEFLLRFPPEDPACLVRAALVCKRWCRLISGTDFRRRFRELHGTRPMLGYLCNLVGGGDANTIGERLIVRFVPTSSHSSWRPRPIGYPVLDSRHGRVLLCSLPLSNEAAQIRLFVWDPITDERVELPTLPDSYYCGWNAAVLCATSSGGGGGCCCGSLDCHRSPFLVVFMATTMSSPLARVYSSGAGTWSEVITSNITCEDVIKQPCALAGNALYFMSALSDILKFDLATRRISRIDLPGAVDLYSHGVLTTNQDGGLEFVQVGVGSELHRWSREADDVDDEGAGWARRRVIDLKDTASH